MKASHITLLLAITTTATYASAIVGVNGYQVGSFNLEPNTPNGPQFTNTTGYTSPTAPLSLSFSSSDGYSSGYLNATAQFGLLQISTSADANSPDRPSVRPNSGNASGSIYFEDALDLSDPGAPANTQIALLVTLHLDDAITDTGDPEAPFCPSSPSILVELTASVGTIFDTSCALQSTRTISSVEDLSTNANGQAFYDPGLTLIVDDSANTANASAGSTVFSASDVTSVTASGYLTVQVETPNVTVTSASGTDYSVVQTADAPEPSSYALLGAGFMGLGLLRKRRKGNE